MQNIVAMWMLFSFFELERIQSKKQKIAVAIRFSLKALNNGYLRAQYSLQSKSLISHRTYDVRL